MSKRTKDLLERILWTFVQAFAAEWLISSTFDQRSFKIAGAAAAISAVKCIVAFNVGNPNSASLAPDV